MTFVWVDELAPAYTLIATFPGPETVFPVRADDSINDTASAFCIRLYAEMRSGHRCARRVIDRDVTVSVIIGADPDAPGDCGRRDVGAVVDDYRAVYIWVRCCACAS